MRLNTNGNSKRLGSLDSSNLYELLSWELPYVVQCLCDALWVYYDAGEKQLGYV
jgi:hypothetical protein